MAAMASSSADLGIHQKKSLILRAVLLLYAGSILGAWLYATPGGLIGKVDAIGYAVCHQINARTFHYSDNAMPMCARCTGMYLGVLLTLAFYHIHGKGRARLFPSWPLAIMMIGFTLIWAVDGINSYLTTFPNAPHFYTPNNTLRLMAGTLIGIDLATLILVGFNQTIWRHAESKPVLSSFSEMAQLLGGAAILDVAILSELPILLYPLALLSSLSVLVVLISVYSTTAILMFHRENQATSWRNLTFPIIAGLSMAMTHIALLDLGRFWLTKTWDGFLL